MSITYPHPAKSVLLSCIDDRIVQSDAQFAKAIGNAFNPRIAGVTHDSDRSEIDRLYSDLDAAAENARETMVQAGAPEEKIIIHTQVVNPAGVVLERA